jgi:hypothetical protein
MPLPRRYGDPDPIPVNGKSGFLAAIRTAPAAYGRKPTPAEAQRRWRAGNGPGKTGGTRFIPVWDTAPPNGLPGPCYTYRGTGRDAYDGSDLFEEAS